MLLTKKLKLAMALFKVPAPAQTGAPEVTQLERLLTSEFKMSGWGWTGALVVTRSGISLTNEFGMATAVFGVPTLT